VRGDPIKVGDSEGAHSGGGEVQRYWASQPPGAHDENLRLSETLLALRSDFGEQQVPTVAAEFVGGEQGHVAD
jgi:hypothetical protein